MDTPQAFASTFPVALRLSPKSPAPSKPSNNPTSIGRWVHTTPTFVQEWLLFSIPLIIWDLGYVLLRPLSMPGGSLHSPIWAPYEKYVRTDYIYGWKAWDEKNGFTAAQASMNVPETLLYLVYLYLVYTQGAQLKQVALGGSGQGILAKRCIAGQPAAVAIMAGFTGAVMTFSKTVLYGLNEAFSGWGNVGHNDWSDLVLFYMIPNGAWLVASALMSFAFGREILQVLTVAAGAPASEDELLVRED